jgi:TRAF3-interacting protein 1
LYEQIIQKPKFNEKLLTKPPFRYIHDIFTNTMAVTGFGNGLFDEEELDGKAITEKEAKINWLTKLISLTELVVGEEIDCKPTKIVAGHEPEKTNFFLQQMFHAATAGIDTTPHVMQILGVQDDDEGG